MKPKFPIPWAIVRLIIRFLPIPEPYKTLLLSVIDYVENLPDGPKKDELKGEFAKAAMNLKADGRLAHFKSVLEKCTGAECRVSGYEIR